MRLKTTFFKKIIVYGITVLGSFSSKAILAQGTPCAGQAAYGCGYRYGYCGDVDGIKITNSAGTLIASYSGQSCNTVTSYRGVMNQGSSIDLTAGEEVTIELTGTEWNGYYTRPGVWMDVSLDNQFQAAECVIDPASFTIGATATTFKVKVPCFTKAGTSYLRVRGSMTAFNMTRNNGCGSVNTYGNVFDIVVNYKLGTTPVANFAIPKDTMWEGSPVLFSATSPNAGANYTWKFDKASVIINNNSTKGSAQWNTAGKYDVFMKVDYCGIADSITKQVRIDAPTQAPVADFIADNNEVEVGYDVNLFDLSKNGATGWAWEIYSPTGMGDDVSTAKNAKFNIVEGGWHKVCLTSSNSKGNSKTVCKDRYIEGLPTLDNYMGPQKIASTRYGRLFDHAGPTANYAANRKTSIDYFQILPCGAKEIRLSFSDLELADNGDKFTIYDSDQEDPNKLVAQITGANFKLYDTAVFKLKSGAGFLTFESNGSGQGRGFVLNWDSDLETPTAPDADFTFPYSKVGNGVEMLLTNTTANTKGVPEYLWLRDDGTGTNTYFLDGTSVDYDFQDYNDATHKVCLVAATCTGNDTMCKNITVYTPTSPSEVDFVASNQRPSIGQTVKFTTTTDFADKYIWSIFPTTFKFVNGTSASSQNPEIEFTAGGAYTFTLTAYNDLGGRSLTEKKVIKNKYVICIDYCIPLTNMVSKDIAINSVKVTDKNNLILLNSETASGTSYNDYTDKKPMNMTYGAKYNVEVTRKSSSNDANYKVWVDWNIDGDFDDQGEEVLATASSKSQMVSGSFTVPELSKSFEGVTRMRVGVSYGNFANLPCGVNQVGEFEDYAIKLANDNSAPQINLIGSDTVRVERGTSASSCYQEIASQTYVGVDATEGDVTNKVVITSDLDCLAAGVYSMEFNLTDASGNKAQPKTRTIIVVLDRTGPVLTLQGKDTVTIEQCGTFSDPGAVANDAVDGDLTTAIKVAGTVDPATVGDYTLTYNVKDAQGNESSKTRVVKVRDTQKPGIYRLGSRITDKMVINVQINQAFVDDIYALDPCNGNIFLSKTPGFNGVVNNQERATYPIIYNAKDPSGNAADEDGFTILYVVDDFIAPNIELNTSDTVLHDVNEPYASRNATVTDNYYAASQVSVVRTGKVDPYTLGTYVETFIATDASGNKATKMRYVKVVDRIAPELTAPAVSACIGSPFWAMSGLIVKDNYYSSSDLMPLIKVVYSNVNIYEAGAYSINYSIIDPAGNEAAIVSRTVYVQYPPNCQNTFLGNADLKLEDAVSVYPNPTSGKVNVAFSLNNNEPLQVSVVNAVGANVANYSFEGGVGNQEIDLGSFGTGVYFIRMTNNGQSTMKKLVVNN